MDLAGRLERALGERYSVDREIGRGGTSVVFVATDLKHERRVAIKVLRPELAATLAGDRFLREIRIAAGLTHPHILPLYDSGSSDGLIFYAMPFVEGESLHHRLEREGPLPVGDAIRLAIECCAALGHAHAHGVIHRDIKPANILLQDEQALIADFGIAHALTSAGSERITSTSAAVGTPMYMSPEQGSGRSMIDGRSDIYSLGCVLFEMLVGEPPFLGNTPVAVIARHATETPPPLSALRPTIPGALQLVLDTAMAKVPADRFANAHAFAEALRAVELTGETRPGQGRIDDPTRHPRESARQPAGTPLDPPGTRRLWTRRRGWLIPAGLVVLVASAAVVWWASRNGNDGPGTVRYPGVVLDTTSYAIIPIGPDQATAGATEVTGLLEDALRWWEGITVVERYRVREALAQYGAVLTLDNAMDAAASIGAGRLAVVEGRQGGNSVPIHLYDTGTGKDLDTRSARIPADSTAAAAVFAALADSLLFRSSGRGLPTATFRGTRSATARRAYNAGIDAVSTWDLARADSQFVAATGADPNYGMAHLWLAQVRMWQNRPKPEWESPARRAATGRDLMSERDRLLSEALLRLSTGDAGRACPMWKGLAELDSLDFTAWYGYGACLSQDSLVVPDATGSPSGWRFRSSVAEAADAFHEAFLLWPALYHALSGGAFSRVRSLLHTSRHNLRGGYAAPPDTTHFLAYPEWRDGRLAFIPYPAWQVRTGALPDESSGFIEEAVLHQRQVFRRLAQSWSTQYPDSADAVEAVAIALELLNDESAIDTLQRARSLARDDATYSRIAATEVWVRLKYSIARNSRGVAAARMLADSVLRANPPEQTRDGRPFTGLAALLGRAGLASAYEQTDEVVGGAALPAVVRYAAPLLAFASLGGPGDSLRYYEEQLTAATGRLSPAERSRTRSEWLIRAATIAFPDFTFAALSESPQRTGDYLFDAQADYLRGDGVAARAALQKWQTKRISADIRPEELTFDAVLPEAALLALLGDTSRAIEWLDLPLQNLGRAPPLLYLDAARAGSLVRAMALRARLAAAVGDADTARRWAAIALELLERPDPFLRPVVADLDRIRR